jgi:hypothetical protein
MAFQSVRSRLKDLPDTVVSEADPNFEKIAHPKVREAVAIAQKQAGVVEKSADWERTATPEERRQRLQESLTSEKKLTQEEISEYDKTGKLIAKYKIELTFSHARKAQGENWGLIQVWEGGKHLHGGGDQQMMFCTDTREPNPAKRSGCGNFISADDILEPPSLDANGNPYGGIAFCRNCKKQVIASRLADYYTVHGSYQHIAEVLVGMFRKLGSNANINIKYHKTDIRYIAMARREGLHKAKQLKGLHVYPLDRIVRDTAAGADLVKRFKAFLTA